MNLVANLSTTGFNTDSTAGPVTSETPDLTGLRHVQTTPNSVTTSTGIWFVTLTKPRSEQKAVRELHDRDGITLFRPTQEITRTETDGHGREFKRRIELPLLQGYLSWCVQNDDERYRVKSHSSTATLITVKDQDLFRREIAKLELLADESLEVLPLSKVPLKARVRVVDGPYRGMTGRLVNRDKRTKFGIEITAFNQLVILQIDPSRLEPV